MTTEAADSPLRIGQELVRRKLVGIDQVRECLRVQEELRRQGKEAPIGNILVARGIVGLEDLKEVLSSLKLLILYCPTCRLELVVEDYRRDNQYICNQCSGELIFTSHRPRPNTPVSQSAATAPPSGDDLIGKELGGCRVVERIAAGGMGTVYKAEQINLGRAVALKVLAQDLAEDELFVKRFLQEARAAAALNHTNIIHINDAGFGNGVFFYTMEYVEGEDLAHRLQREGKLRLAEALEIAEQVVEALLHAHKQEIVHRDIKPENIMLTPEGKVKLADLGLAKKVMGGDISTVTQAGSILGTPYYMAPEQARDFRNADARSDLYSLGVTFYKALSGDVPFEGSTPIEVMMKALEGDRRPLSEVCPDIPPDVEQFVDRLMHVDPDSRFQDAAQVRASLQTLINRHAVVTD
ncbi:MAG: serine/threonine-protein kinase [Planctomycetota bacterium]